MLHFFGSIFNFILPRLCSGCSRKLGIESKVLCTRCETEMVILNKNQINEAYNQNFRQDKYIDDFISLYLFIKNSTIQTLLHEFKYKSKFNHGIYFGNKIADFYGQTIVNWEIDYIAPIPLHKQKNAERGYNQAKYIAKGISEGTRINLNDKIIQRRKKTTTQTKLTKEERKDNMYGAFAVKNKRKVEGKKILIVDDVITTGATINACAQILKEAGAEKVYAVSAAQTPK